MKNSTEVENCKTIQELCCLASLQEPQRTIIYALNILLSIIALTGNVLIFVALRKVSSLHPPSKLLFGCLASTDFCVGLVSQPLFVIFIFAPELSELRHYSTVLTNTIGFIFSGVSLLTMTAISVDRLFALMLRLRYRQVVTLRRVWFLVIFFWLFSTGFSITMVYKRRLAETIASIIMLLCLVISLFCYLKIYVTLHLHQAQVKITRSQGQPNEARIPPNIARYRQTVSSALWVQMTLLVCYLPFAVVTGLRGVLGLQSAALHQAHAVTITLLLLNSTLNPFLYCWKIKDVRRAVKDSIKKLKCLSG